MIENHYNSPTNRSAHSAGADHDNDEVHAWTAGIDELFTARDTRVTIAVDDTGKSDAVADGTCQVSAGCVNALATGACDGRDASRQPAVQSGCGCLLARAGLCGETAVTRHNGDVAN